MKKFIPTLPYWVTLILISLMPVLIVFVIKFLTSKELFFSSDLENWDNCMKLFHFISCFLFFIVTSFLCIDARKTFSDSTKSICGCIFLLIILFLYTLASLNLKDEPIFQSILEHYASVYRDFGLIIFGYALLYEGGFSFQENLKSWLNKPE